MVGPQRIGLTGGIGCGKSTVASLLAQAGAAIIDADAISRTLTASGGLAIEPIRQAFGAAAIGPDGALNRPRMRDWVFANPAAKAQLEHIIHPLVKQQTAHQAALAQAEGHTTVVFDVPLLVESGTWRHQVDAVWVVDCLPDTQLTRVMARNALTKGAVQAIMATQALRLTRLQAADAVIFNDTLTLIGLAQEVHQLARAFGLSLPNLTD